MILYLLIFHLVLVVNLFGMQLVQVLIQMLLHLFPASCNTSDPLSLCEESFRSCAPSSFCLVIVIGLAVACHGRRFRKPTVAERLS